MIAVIADTHMPKGERALPEACVETIRAAEALVHAGDFSAAAVLADLEALCPVVLAVHGNVDDAELRRRLPESLEFEVAGRTVAVVHDSGPRSGRLGRMRSRFPGADAVIFGHSHMPLHEEEGGFQIFNPGSPTERRRAPRRSMGLLHPTASGLRFEHVWFG
ncbi:MAG TPA: metallophosphoesterase family protein [Solirubrobacterales bacterium]|nr:metallophosphoesterase family protein [Solirubrobacterales bacterium]